MAIDGLKKAPTSQTWWEGGGGKVMGKDLLVVLTSCLAGFMGGIFASQGQVNASSSAVIRASKFELLNAQGSSVSTWEAGLGKEAHLRFGTGTHFGSADLGASPDGSPTFQMAGHDGIRRVFLGLGKSDRPVLSMSDERWDGRIVLGFVETDTDQDNSAGDDWELGFQAIGSTRPVLGMGITRTSSGVPGGYIVLSGKRIR